MTALAVKAGRRSVEISNPVKVLFPDDGITKADLATYYERTAETMPPRSSISPTRPRSRRMSG